MSNRNEHRLSDLIDAALRRYSFSDTVVCGQVEGAYRKVVGEMINKLTYRCDYVPQTRVLYVKMASPALRNEMTMHASGLVESINKTVGRAEVRHVVFR
ncbi:MAG: DciA family protein [Bacteroidales bacterium]|nr:DciA family protein [Bacteroidales bacterium]